MSTLNMNDIFKKEDNALLLNWARAQIKLPASYFEHNISVLIGREIDTFGLFKIAVWEHDIEHEKPLFIEFKFPSIVRTIPDRIYEERDGEELYYVLEYISGDKIIKSLLIAKNDEAPRVFIDLLFKGYIPDSIPYDEIYDIWTQCNSINEINFAVSSVIMELVVSSFARDPHLLERPFRLALNDKNNKYTMYDRKMISSTTLPKISSSFAALSSGDPRQGITASIVRTRSGSADEEVISPIEDAIF